MTAVGVVARASSSTRRRLPRCGRHDLDRRLRAGRSGTARTSGVADLGLVDQHHRRHLLGVAVEVGQDALEDLGGVLVHGAVDQVHACAR